MSMGRRCKVGVPLLLSAMACQPKGDAVLRGRTPAWYLAGENVDRVRYSVYNEEVTRTSSGTYLIWIDEVRPEGGADPGKRRKFLVEFDCRKGTLRTNDSDIEIPSEKTPWTQAPPGSMYRYIQRVACDAVEK